MKKIIFFISLFIVAGLISCGPYSDDAVKYNDELVEQQTKVFEKESILIDAINKNMPEKLDTALNSLVDQVKESTEATEKIKEFEGGTELKDAALKVLSTYKGVIQKEYIEMIKIAKTPDSLYTQEDDNKIIDISKKIDDKLNQIIESFIKKQKEFSNKNKFELPLKEIEKK
ncbi:MAG: hypothetical protein HGB12_07055 [Bacteroidetes bacterium]|nr:hypothetical protein [Bacteroidota bacterium]